MKTGLKLQTIILLFTIPALVLITSVYAYMNYNTLYATILGGFDRKLFAVSTTSASFIDGDEHRKITSEEDPKYIKYVEPMRKILASAGLTYHYTIVPIEDNKIRYVLDATEGSEHSPAGSTEENPEVESERLNLVMKTGQASLSDIQEFDIWGQLKVGSAPIFDSKGQVAGLLGADVNISLINAKMNQAMLMIFGIGVIALLLATWVSLIITRRFIEPIDRIKQAALEVAAGKFGVEVHVANPRELKELAETFTQTSRTLKETQESDKIYKEQQSRFLAEQNLKEEMSFIDENACKLKGGKELRLKGGFQVLSSEKWNTGASGSVTSGKYSAAWFVSRNASREDLKLHFDLVNILNRMLSSPQLDLHELQLLLGAEIQYLLIFEHENNCVQMFAKDKVHPKVNLSNGEKAEFQTGKRPNQRLLITTEGENAISR